MCIVWSEDHSWVTCAGILTHTGVTVYFVKSLIDCIYFLKSIHSSSIQQTQFLPSSVSCIVEEALRIITEQPYQILR